MDLALFINLEQNQSLHENRVLGPVVHASDIVGIFKGRYSKDVMVVNVGFYSCTLFLCFVMYFLGMQ